MYKALNLIIKLKEKKKKKIAKFPSPGKIISLYRNNKQLSWSISFYLGFSGHHEGLRMPEQ